MADKIIRDLDTAAALAGTEYFVIDDGTSTAKRVALSAISTFVNLSNITSFTIASANGISGSVSAGSTPIVTLTLGAITPTSVNGITLSGTGGITNAGSTNLSAFTGSGASSGTNTGDNATNSQYSGLAASKADVGQTFYIGTTQVAINRASSPLTLAGITLTTPDIGVATATSVNKLSITPPTTSATLTIADGKTLTVSNTCTLQGGDAFVLSIAAAKTFTVLKTISITSADDTGVYTLPTGTKTIAANDGTNRTIASQAIGDLLVASSTTAYARLAIGTSGFVLRSNGTTAVWDTDYALTFNYQITTSVASGDITITLLNYLGTTPSSTTPVRFMVNNTLVTYTSAQTITINNDSFYHFNAGSAQLATFEVDYFLYAASSGGLCVSRLPWYTNFAQGGANQEAFIANGGGFSTQDLINIGRFNATKASGTTGNRSIPATSFIVNKPIYYTRPLAFTPTLQGSGGSIGTMTASPYTGTYTVRDSGCHYILNIQCTNVGSWTGNVEINLPWISKNEMGDNPVIGFVCPSGANPATASRAMPYIVANSNLQRHLSGVDTANLAWGTFVVNDRIRAKGFYNIN